MQIFRNISLVKKLTFLLLVASASSLIVASACFFTYEWFNLRRTIRNDVQAVGKIVSSNVTPILLAKNAVAAKTLLQSMAAKPGIVYSQLQLPNHVVLAENGQLGAEKDAITKTTKDGLARVGPYLVLHQPIMQKTIRTGTLVLVYDYDSTQQRLIGFHTIATLLILAGAIVLSTYLASRLQGLISTPILELLRTAQGITEQRDYTLRAPKGGNDEIGELTNAFNRMLDEVQGQDAKLQKVPEELNKKVEAMEHEISERKRVEESLRTAEIKYRTLVEQLPMITYNADANQSGAWFYVSPQIEAILGFTQDEWVGNPKIWDERLHADDRETFNAKAELMDRNGDQFICEYRIYDSYGRLHWFRDQSAIVRDPVKKQTYTHGFLLDVTEQKQAEMELDTLQLQLLDISRQAGMAEVATGVLHNVGNVLNSVNVSTTILGDLIKNSKLASLSKVTTLLREHTNDLGKYISSDPKGKQLPTYLVSLTEHLSEEHVDMVNELAMLVKNVEHIKHIVSMQQSYAKVSGMVESVSPKDLVEDALQINGPSFARNGIKVVREEGASLPNVAVEKHKVLQILVNLLRNSKNAMEEVPRKDRKITLSVALNGDSKVKITVRDQGCGIAPDNLTRIFSHGFTTKTDGHGFGLHIGALAAQEMGGSLHAESDGPGTGAAFILELPVANAKSLS
ncbi:MAG TPA: ATP-binding protein [Chthoniobacterales bacterium]|jgi:PAS domain S-box-containing protein